MVLTFAANLTYYNKISEKKEIRYLLTDEPNKFAARILKYQYLKPKSFFPILIVHWKDLFIVFKQHIKLNVDIAVLLLQHNEKHTMRF